MVRAALLFGLLGSVSCSMVSGMLGPAPVLPSRAMQRVLPVPRLIGASEAIGSCVHYASDGSYVLEACPPGLAGMADGPTEYKAPKGEHEAGVLFVDAREPPLGFSGNGTYWHVREAHVTRVVTSQLGGGRLGAMKLDRLDALCHEVRESGDRIIVDRAYLGCAVVADGTGELPQTSEKATQQLEAQGRRLGGPKDFRIDGGSVADATCDGEETTVLVGVVALSTVCDEIVRDAVQAQASKDVVSTLAEIEKTQRDFAAKQQAAPRVDARERNGRERVAAMAAAIIAFDMQIENLRRQYEDAVDKAALYRGDPYGVRTPNTHEHASNDRVARH